jgi:hypothetical protein
MHDDEDRVDGRDLRPLREPGSDDLLARWVRERIERMVARALHGPDDGQADDG